MSDTNKAVIQAFIEEALKQQRFERANNLAKEDFAELDPFSGQLGVVPAPPPAS